MTKRRVQVTHHQPHKSVRQYERTGREEYRLTLEEFLANCEEPPWEKDHEAPERFSDCERYERGTPGHPCPFVTCEHNPLAKPYRSGIYFPFPLYDENGTPYDVDWSAAQAARVFTCLAKLPEQEVTLEDIGGVFGDISRERARQIGTYALMLLARGAGEADGRDQNEIERAIRNLEKTLDNEVDSENDGHDGDEPDE